MCGTAHFGVGIDFIPQCPVQKRGRVKKAKVKRQEFAEWILLNNSCRLAELFQA